MKRRDFLKILGIGIIAPGIAIAAVKAEPKISIDPSKPSRWKNFYAEFKLNTVQKRILREKFRKAFKNTKFKPSIKSDDPKRYYLVTCPSWKMQNYKRNFKHD